jgi:hypothetical protein
MLRGDVAEKSARSFSTSKLYTSFSLRPGTWRGICRKSLAAMGKKNPKNFEIVRFCARGHVRSERSTRCRRPPAPAPIVLQGRFQSAGDDLVHSQEYPCRISPCYLTSNQAPDRNRVHVRVRRLCALRDCQRVAGLESRPFAAAATSSTSFFANAQHSSKYGRSITSLSPSEYRAFVPALSR